MAQALDLVVVGQATLDTIRTDAGSAHDIPGGSALYVSAVAASLGVRVGLVARVGYDFPADTLAVLAAKGIDLRGLKVSKTPTDRIVLERSGAEVTAFGMQCFSSSFLAADVPTEFWDTPWIHLTAMDVPRLACLARLARKRGCEVSLGLQYYLGHQRSLTNTSLDEFAQLLMHVTIVFCNQDEACALAKKSNHDYVAAAQDIAGMGPQTVVVTRGEAGILTFHRANLIESAAERAASIIDQTGAGDAFSAGFLSAYIQGLEVRSCAKRGAHVAAQIIQDYGCSAFLKSSTPSTDS